MTAATATAKLWQAWLVAIVFIFPIPHTIALRNLLLLLGLLALLWTGRESLPKPAPSLKPAAWWLLALTAWIVFHSVAVAVAPILALDELRANWVMPLLLGVIGAWAATQLPREHAVRAVVLTLAAHMIWMLGWQLKIWMVTGAWPFQATPFANYDYQSTLNSFLLALLLADRMVWILNRYSPLALNSWAGWALLLLSLVADFALQTRNSTIVSLAMIFAASLILLKLQSRNRRIAMLALCLLTLLGAGSITFDQRWQGMRESILVGWTSPSQVWMTATVDTWYTVKWPATPSGRPLEQSAYTRAVMARQSVDFIAAHPLGIGFGHDAFGRAIELKYGHPGMGSSHSGWLDFALGTGLPGLVLLLATAGVAIRCGWRKFRERQDAQALLLVFFVGGYILRCLLDGHLSGWRLGLFAFICGVLIAAMKRPPAQA